MAKPFFFRLQANDLAAEVMERSDDDLVLWVKQLANDLLRADLEKSKTDLGRKLIVEACNYRESKALAGKLGGKAKASSAKAKASSAKAVLKQNVADPYPEAVAVQKQYRTEPLKPLSDKPDESIISEVIQYLCEKSGKKFSLKTEATRKFIRARISEGATLEQFKAAVDNQCAQWLTDPKNNKYLRPETLFNASKFEGYVNNTMRGGSTDGKFEIRNTTADVSDWAGGWGTNDET